jgi:histidine ammonia-lyase
MAAHGARRLGPMADNLFHILGMEIFCGTEGIRHRAPLETSPALTRVTAHFHSHITPLNEDRFLAPDLETAATFAAGHGLLETTKIEFPSVEEMIND